MIKHLASIRKYKVEIKAKPNHNNKIKDPLLPCAKVCELGFRFLSLRQPTISILYTQCIPLGPRKVKCYVFDSHNTTREIATQLKYQTAHKTSTSYDY